MNINARKPATINRGGFLAIALIFCLVFPALAADVNYPYGSVNLRLPPAEDPIPGFGGAYSALPFGMKSVLVNPATLAKLKLAESFLLISSTAGLNAASRTTNVTETSGTFEGGT